MSRRDDAPRDLLFGLLALQNGMVSRDQLVAAFGAWTASTRSMADLLVDHGALTPHRRAVLEALAEEHLAAHGGDPEASLAALEVGPSTREGLALAAGPDVESSLARVGSGGRLEPDGTDPEGRWRRVCGAFASAPRREPADDARAVAEGGLEVPTTSRDGRGPGEATTVFPAGASADAAQRFRLLRPHARGGLGAVYVALDAELNREVALKRILDEHADDPASRRRFVAEAEITGGLEHPGIVPVYGLGSYDDGRPYYAMRLISGETLRQAIERFHRPGEAGVGSRDLRLRRLLRRFVDVCNAIDYAHSRGVLHRDIKPGNVIVGKHGETLVVDWGLAKATGRSDPSGDERTLRPRSGDGSSETLPGSALGTPAFMSPEQAAGALDRLGPRSDVYGLGATLYCLLTGRAPFAGGVGDVLDAVRRGEFLPPRAIDPAIDRALEAVCLEAMASRPEDRHATARALADDVERWMADEPVSAWREPLARRARRWARRNRTAVATAAVALVAVVIGLSAVLVVQARANAELARSNAAVQARYDLAVEAIRTFHTGVSRDFLLGQGQFKELRDRLLTSASDFYGKLRDLLERETDRASRRALAASNDELATLTAQVGRPEDALAAHRAVLAARRALASGPGADAEMQVDVARSLMAVASLLNRTGRAGAALATYREAEALLSVPAAGSTRARSALAACRSGMGDILSATGEKGQALAAYRLARSDQEAPAAVAGAPDDARRDLAETVHRIGVLLGQTGHPGEAEAELRAALAIRRKLVEEGPAVTEFRRSLAAGRNNLGILLFQTGRPGEAEAEFRAALEVLRKLADDFPAVTEFRGSLVGSHNNLGILLSQTGRPMEAEAAYRAALEVLRELADDYPAVTEFRSRLADGHNNLGILLGRTGHPREAESEFRAALALRRELAEEGPAVTEFRSRLADGHNNLGDLLHNLGRPGEAESEYRRALAILEKLAEENPAVPRYRRELTFACKSLARALRDDGSPADALPYYRRAVEALQREADAAPSEAAPRDFLAWFQTDYAMALREAGRDDEAIRAARAALAIWRGRIAEEPGSKGYRDNLGWTLGELEHAVRRTGNRSEWLEAVETLPGAFDAAIKARPDVAEYRGEKARALIRVADALRALGRAAEARRRYEEGIAIHEGLIRAGPSADATRGELARGLRRLGLARRDLGDPAGASADIRRALGLLDGLASRSGEDWFETACCHAALAGLAGSAGEGHAEADRAMEGLNRAVAMGYRDLPTFRAEDALGPLSGRPDFRLLMMDLAMPDDPIAGRD